MTTNSDSSQEQTVEPDLSAHAVLILSFYPDKIAIQSFDKMNNHQPIPLEYFQTAVNVLTDYIEERKSLSLSIPDRIKDGSLSESKV